MAEKSMYVDMPHVDIHSWPVLWGELQEHLI